MLGLRTLDAFPDPQWRQLVEACQGNPLHLHQVHLGDRDEKDLRYLIFDRNDAAVACAPAFVSTPHLHRLRGKVRTLELPTAAATAMREPGELEEVYRRLIEGCRVLGCGRLVVGHGWGECFDGWPALGGHITERVVEFVLDLGAPLDELLAGMHKAHRKNIRRAEKLGLTVRVETTPEALEQLRQVQLVSAGRSTDRGHGFAVRDANYYRRVHERVYGAGLGEVLLAFQGNDCVGALAYLHLGTKGITVRSGCTRAGYETYAMYLLEHSLLARAKELGLRELNLGGVPADAEGENHPQHGLFEFKRGFGGRSWLRTAAAMDLE
jgi:hypothetical protein